jgi:chromatin remodeling complex protein RSC6
MMNNNTNGNNTMSNTTADKKPRAVKKTEAVSVTATPVVVATPAAPVAEKKPRTVKAKAVETVVAAVAAAPVASPVSAVATDAAPTTTVNDDIRAALESVTRLRDEASKMIAGLRKLDKRVSKEIKEARKRRRSKREVDPTKPKRPNVFQEPQQVSEALCKFFGKPNGTLMSRAEVTSGVSTYVKKSGLQNKHEIKLDDSLKSLLEVPDADVLTYFNIQKYLNKHYIKKAVAAAATVVA